MAEKKITFLGLIRSRSTSFYWYLTLFSIVNSLTNIAILVLVNSAFIPGGGSLFGQHLYEAFILVLVVSFFTTVFFQNHMTEFTNNLIYDLEMTTVKKVRSATYESFSELGRERIYAVIADTNVLGAVPERFIGFITALLSIVCSLAYLFYISVFGGAVIMTVMTALFSVYWIRNKRIFKDLAVTREYQNKYYLYLTELLMGFKQVQISARRNNELFNNYIEKNRTQMRNYGIRSSKKFIINQISGTYSWYLMLGFIVFVLPALYHMEPMEKTAFIMVILYIISPISALINIMSYYSTARVAIERINTLNETLVTNPVENLDETIKHSDFSTIRFENVRYQYRNDEGASFTLELDNFVLHRSETLFIIGGNGSGKTTFINILTGLYPVKSGDIYIDERRVSPEEFRAFSNNMALVFNDHYLFKGNYEKLELTEKNAFLYEMAETLNIRHCLRIDEERGFFKTQLSKGQQKRLSLLLAVLEDKPIIVLDEWAAEQDPANRVHFYDRWIATFKEMGKTLVIITHDDDYFSKADRVVKFNYGKIVQDTREVDIANLVN